MNGNPSEISERRWLDLSKFCKLRRSVELFSVFSVFLFESRQASQPSANNFAKGICCSSRFGVDGLVLANLKAKSG